MPVGSAGLSACHAAWHATDGAEFGVLSVAVMDILSGG